MKTFEEKLTGISGILPKEVFTMLKTASKDKNMENIHGVHLDKESSRAIVTDGYKVIVYLLKLGTLDFLPYSIVIEPVGSIHTFKQNDVSVKFISENMLVADSSFNYRVKIQGKDVNFPDYILFTPHGDVEYMEVALNIKKLQNLLSAMELAEYDNPKDAKEDSDNVILRIPISEQNYIQDKLVQVFKGGKQTNNRYRSYIVPLKLKE